jgi:hypothetical protein
MLIDVTRNRLVGLWFAVVALTIATVAAMDVNVGAATTVLAITLSLVPPGIILALWRDSPPPTIGEILYAVNTRPEGRS